MKRPNSPANPSNGRPDMDLGADPSWEEIRLLLRESNRPAVPSPERLKALRERALQRYAIEHPSLWALFKERLAHWTEALSARSTASRFLHLVAAGATGAVIAILAVQQTSPADDRGPARPTIFQPGPSSPPSIAAAPSPQSSGILPPGAATFPKANAKDPLILADPAGAKNGASMASLLATPSESPAVRIEKSGQAAPKTVPGESVTEAALAGPSADPRLVEPGVKSPSAFVPDSVTQLVGAAPVAARSGAKDPAASGRSPEDSLLEEMGKLRFKLLFNGDHQYLADADELQARLIEVLSTRQGDSPESRQIKALRLFRQAEKAIQEQRYIEAINAYNQVTQDLPGSILALVAHYQIANIEFDYLDQYGSALDEYRLCLENFPSHFFSEEQLGLILPRVEMLRKNSENNWEPLRMFYSGRRSTPRVAQQNLLDLVARYPHSELAGQAAEHLAKLAANDLEGKYIDAERIILALQKAVNDDPASPQAARFQYAIGQVLEQRLFKPDLAITYYQRVLRMNPSPEMNAAATNRLQELNLHRFATPAP